jgi:hypothetical protein
MKLNQRNSVGANGRQARTLKYEDVAAYFSWNKAKKVWLPRVNKSKAVGRVYSVSYLAGKKFYKRVLLLHRKGFCLFCELKKVGNKVAPMYQIACNWLGLLVDDYLYDQTLVESAVSQTGYQLAEMFAIMCVYSRPADPKKLFESHYLAFTDDLSCLDMRSRVIRVLCNSERRVLALFCLRSILTEMEQTLDSCGISISRADT